MAQAGLAYFEPSFVDELAEIFRWSLDYLQAPDGGSVYLRLSTRILDQPQRDSGEEWKRDLLQGAYWQIPPGVGSRLAVVYTGAVAPEAMEAFVHVEEDFPSRTARRRQPRPSPPRLVGWRVPVRRAPNVCWPP